MRSSRHNFVLLAAGSLALLLAPACLHAQISLSSAIDLALKNDSRVKLAQDRVRRSVAAVQETRDAYVPSAFASGGAGYSYGITLTVPTIFTLDAQSLVYSPSQPHYIRAARWDLDAASLALRSAREQVEEDVAVTYISLDSSHQTGAALQQALEHSQALVSVVEHRLNAGVENQMEWMQARRSVAQLQLQMLEQQDEQEDLQQHLGDLTGLPAQQLAVVPESIADLPSAPTVQREASFDTLQAESEARSRQEHSLGDAHSLWKPQVTVNAQYGRVSPINSVTDYYNLHGRYNVAFIGVAVRLPLLDTAAHARQREAKSDAQRAIHELESLHLRGNNDSRKLRHTVAELGAKLELAELDADIAGEQFRLVEREARAGGDGAPIMSPKDVERTGLQERQRYVDLLDAKLQLRKTQILYLRESGSLDLWVNTMRDGAATISGNAPTALDLTVAPRGVSHQR